MGVFCRSTAQRVALVLFVLTIAATGPAVAWKRETNVCGGHRSWHPNVFQNIPYRTLSCSPDGFPGLPGSFDFTDEAGVTTALSNATWMWVREYTSNARIYLDTSVCGSGPENGGWFDRSDTVNEVWFESYATVESFQGGPAIALTGLYDSPCAWPGRHTNLRGFDIMHSNDYGYLVVDQNMLFECFHKLTDYERHASLEHHMLHELGHAYGLGHSESMPSVMNVATRGHHNCHVAQGFSDYPYGDDIAGLMQYNEIDGQSRFNTSGTPWYTSAGVSKFDDELIPMTSSQPISRLVRFTISASYDHPYTVKFRFVVTDRMPVFHWSSGTWSFPGQVWASTPSSLSPTLQGSSVFAKPLLVPAGVPYQRNRWYRVWVEIITDRPETDEGDDVFPTGIQIRISG